MGGVWSGDSGALQNLFREKLHQVRAAEVTQTTTNDYCRTQGHQVKEASHREGVANAT